MNISATDLIGMIAADETIARFARRALIDVVGENRAYGVDGGITVTEIDRAISAIESPSLAEHAAAASLFKTDAEKTYMREAHSVNQAAWVLNALRRYGI